MRKDDYWEEQITYRRAKANDVAGICDIYNGHIDMGGSTFATDYWEEADLFDEIVDHPKNIWFIAENDSQIIGWSTARLYSMRHGYRLTRELAVYLKSQHTGKGYAYELVRQTEETCIDRGIHHLVSRVIAENQQSLQFHYRCGYELVGVQKEIGNLDDRWLDVAILQKLLTETVSDTVS